MPKVSKNIPLEVEVFDALQQSAMISARETYRFLSPYKLSVSQFRTLEILYNQGPLCQKDISEHVVKTTGNMTTVIDSLEKKFLVQRVRDQDDRRRYNVELTTEGKKLVRKLLPRQTDRSKKVMENISKPDLEHLKRICIALTGETRKHLY